MNPVIKRKPTGGKGRTDLLLCCLMVGFAAMTIIGGIFYFKSQKEYKTGDNAYAALAGAVLTVTDSSSPGQAETEPESTFPLSVDFGALKAVNEATVGWIRSDSGIIDYPVMQAGDNDWFLTHLPDGTENKNGSIFMDFRSSADFSDRHTILYGHNMRTGTMFGELVEYGKEGYYEAHPTLLLATPTNGNFLLEVFSGYVVPGNSDIYQLTFESDSQYETYLERIRKLSDFVSPVTVTKDDRIVTLSTCTYDYEDARYVLHCKLTPAE